MRFMMELEQLRQLVAFAECGTLSRAAEALYISQPSLSRTMQALEEERMLFERKPDRIRDVIKKRLSLSIKTG